MPACVTVIVPVSVAGFIIIAAIPKPNNPNPTNPKIELKIIKKTNMQRPSIFYKFIFL